MGGRAFQHYPAPGPVAQGCGVYLQPQKRQTEPIALDTVANMWHFVGSMYISRPTDWDGRGEPSLSELSCYA